MTRMKSKFSPLDFQVLLIERVNKQVCDMTVQLQRGLRLGAVLAARALDGPALAERW